MGGKEKIRNELRGITLGYFFLTVQPLIDLCLMPPSTIPTLHTVRELSLADELVDGLRVNLQIRRHLIDGE